MNPSRRLLSLACCLTAFAASSCFAAPEFLGVLTSGEKTYVALRDDTAKNTAWIAVGGNMGDYLVEAYDAKSETLSLKRGDTIVKLTLKNAVIESAPTVSLLQSLARQGDPLSQTLLEQAQSLELKRNATAAALAKAKTDEARIDLGRQLELDERHLSYYLQRVITARQREAAGK